VSLPISDKARFVFYKRQQDSDPGGGMQYFEFRVERSCCVVLLAAVFLMFKSSPVSLCPTFHCLLEN